MPTWFKKVNKPLLIFVQKIHIFFLILSLLALLVGCYWFVDYYNAQQSDTKKESAAVKKETNDIASEINHSLENIKKEVTKLSKKEELKNYDDPNLENVLSDYLKGHKELFGVGVGYIPKKARSLALYAFWNGTVRVKNESAEYEEANWYKECGKKNFGWLNPYMGTTSAQPIFKYFKPIYRNNEVIGYVYINQSLKNLSVKIRKSYKRNSGYIYILTSDNKFVFHPKNEYLLKEDREYNRFKKNKCECCEPIFHKQSIKSTSRIAETAWELTNISFKDGFLDLNILRKKPINILLAGFTFLMFLTFFILFKFNFKNKLVKGVIGYSILSLLAICIIWFLAYRTSDVEFMKGTKAQKKNPDIKDNSCLILNNTDVHTQISNKNLNDSNQKDPIKIPTGLYIQSVKMVDTYEIQVKGYLWQKYNDEIKDLNYIEKGIIFPEALDLQLNEKEFISEDSSKKNSENKNQGYKKNGIETYMWDFEATFRENFDYLDYPFDSKDVWIRMWPKSFEKNVVLVPDLDGYTLYNPRVLPGIANDLEIENFIPEYSYFQYHKNNYDSNFGIQDYTMMNNNKELYFVLIMKRDFIDPLVKNLLPIIVMLFIIFAIIITIHKDQEGKLKIGNFEFSSLLATCSGILFSVILAHIDVRGNFKVQEIMFIEYFYIILYVLIVFVVVNGYAFALNSSIKIIEYKNNLIPKLLFWPLVLTSLMAISIVKFY